MRRDRALDLEHGDRDTAGRRCDIPGCHEAGQYRAPKDRKQLEDYFWFCLDHVREYNRAWNFYAGMSPEQIEAEIRQDTVWRRPSWPLGNQSSQAQFRTYRNGRVHDGFAGFDYDREEAAEAGWQRNNRQRTAPDTEEDRALRMMDLDGPVTLTRLKARYKELVKELHPDANGGDKAAEDRLKSINQAYATLKKAVRDDSVGEHL